MIAKWIPLYWEPVKGTGERLMAGVIAQFDGDWIKEKIIRDEILDSLYGKQSANPKILINQGLSTALDLISNVGFEFAIQHSPEILGLYLGKYRETEALSTKDLMRQAALLYSSLANLDSFEVLEESDTPSQEDTNKRFATEVKELVTARRLDLREYFNKAGNLTNDGLPVRFGFLSHRAVFHFSVINSIRQSNGVRDARARLWELSNAQQYASIPFAGLITGVSSFDDPSLGVKQKNQLEKNIKEIEKEADKWNMRFLPVNSSSQAADCVIKFADH